MRRIGFLATVFLLLFIAVPSAAIQYRIAKLEGLPAGSISAAYLINNSGRIYGGYRMPEEEYGRDFILQGGHLLDFRPVIPGFPQCAAHGMNDSGDVVGHCWRYEGDLYVEQAFRWRDGVTTGLGFLPGDYRSAASGISDGGQVVGGGMERHENPDMPGEWLYLHRAVVWDRGVPSSLGPSAAIAVNGAVPTRIVGLGEGDMPASWSGGTASTLPCPGPYDDVYGMATAVNDVGQTVGHCFGSWRTSSGYAAMLWEPDGSATVLCDGHYSRADHISNAGTVIANCNDAYFLWDRDHGLQPILALLDGSAEGWSDLVLEDINDGGTIVGHGFSSGMQAAFILTPVNGGEPDSDSNSPTGSILVENATSSTRHRAVTLTLAAADTGGSGLDGMRLSNGGGTWSAWKPYQTSRSWTLTAGAGVKTVRVQFRDKAGNVSDADPSKEGAQPYHDTIIYDPIPPGGSIRINRGAASTGVRTVSLKLPAADTGGAGLQSMRFSNGDGIWSAWEPYAVSKAWELSGEAGSKIVFVKFLDAAGNVSDADPLKAGTQGYRDTIEFTGR